MRGSNHCPPWCTTNSTNHHPTHTRHITDLNTTTITITQHGNQLPHIRITDNTDITGGTIDLPPAAAARLAHILTTLTPPQYRQLTNALTHAAAILLTQNTP